jgi:ubiquinone/menaquinone biosynthesis C-methylase UbiE
MTRRVRSDRTAVPGKKEDISMNLDLLDEPRSGISGQPHSTPVTYALGHTEAELRRLALQSALFGDATGDLFRRAGLAPGMRVLDLGCGAGDVSLLAAEFVGPTGSVTGIDRSADAVAWARRRAQIAGLHNLSFAAADLDGCDLSAPVDAIVGRFVLMYLRDPAATLARLRRRLRPGGCVAFVEFDTTIPGISVPEMPLVETCRRWIWAALRQSGADAAMGLKLPAVFRQAGLSLPQLSVSAAVAADADSPAYENAAEAMRSLLPRMEEFGIASAREVEIDTLAERLRAEARRLDGIFVYPATIGAWARTR